jgi:hypothetical protein
LLNVATKLACHDAPPNEGCAIMGEAEYYQLLDVVGHAMNPAPARSFRDVLGEDEDYMIVPVPANDNEGPWPHLPFPAGWTASC